MRRLKRPDLREPELLKDLGSRVAPEAIVT